MHAEACINHGDVEGEFQYSPSYSNFLKDITAFRTYKRIIEMVSLKNWF